MTFVRPFCIVMSIQRKENAMSTIIRSYQKLAPLGRTLIIVVIAFALITLGAI